jgi:SAM-dependent methyltransferase
VTKEASSRLESFLEKVHPERAVAGFTKFDGTVAFYSFVKAIMREQEARRVLDFGAGRGAWYHGSQKWKRELQDLRQYGAKVTACDVDPIVREHPASDRQLVIAPGQPLPFPDGHFDMIVSDVTFEHIEDPAFVSAELARILRPGGFLCARTPNKYGYAKIFTGLVPNRLHSRLLKRIQPDRESQDVFPTFFRMNTVRALRRFFPGWQVSWFRTSAEPAYYFGNPLLYRLFMLVHKLLPDAWATSICFLIRKPG